MPIAALISLLIGGQPALSFAPVSQDAREHAVPSDLISDLRRSDFAEVYIIPPWISYAAAPTPSTVRLSGCKYYVSRHGWNGDMPAGRELEAALARLKIEPADSVPSRQVYFGLVLGDEKGTLREIYSDIWTYPAGKVFALDARRQVHVSERFSENLVRFAARHPELAQGPAERCPRLDVPALQDYPPIRKK